ncbi:hypothetical protein Cni_G09873 [Canna indica]|uniref:Sugar phosphate transporter domain-containing protein n=1 Tax=Canna indica TaxID=4628 RepID=A0AAQ3K4U6_9LILI|nr:hypothetical protein Cni_G09873 [Canna indica]
MFWIATGEYVSFRRRQDELDEVVKSECFMAVSLSCIFGFATRKAISETSFTVTDMVNKFLTMAVNVMVWDKHASTVGLACLLSTTVGGVVYQQPVIMGLSTMQ